MYGTHFDVYDLHASYEHPSVKIYHRCCRSYIKVRSDHQRSGVFFLSAARNFFGDIPRFTLRQAQGPRGGWLRGRGLPFDKLRDRVGGGLGRDRVGALRVLSMSKHRDRGESGSGMLGGSGDVLGATDRRSLRCPPLYWPPIRGAKV